MVLEDSSSPPDDRSRVTILASTLRDLREDMQTLIHDGDKNLYERLATRLDAMDKASELLSENVNRVPTLLDRVAAQMKELFFQKFDGVKEQLIERGERNKDASASARQATTDALTYLKELSSTLQTTNKIAIDKSEAGFKDQLKALDSQLGQTKETLSTLLNDVKDRISRLETASSTVRETKADAHMTVGSIMGIVGGCLAGLSFIVTLGLGIWAVSHSSTPTQPPIVNPTIGADTKRVDDLISQQLDRNRDITARLDALSARLNSTQSRGQYVQPTPP